MGTFGNIGSESRSDIVCLEGNGARPSHKGNGYSVGGAMYTLNSVEVHAVCYGLDTYNQNAEEELMPTIRTNGGGDCIPKVAYSIDKAITTGANCTAGGNCSHQEYVPPLTTDRPHAVVYAVENHPNDSRVKLAEDNIVQVLTSRMGTGGGQRAFSNGEKMNGCNWDGEQVVGTLTHTTLTERSGCLTKTTLCA